VAPAGSGPPAGEEGRMLNETDDHEEIIERVAALDIG
jgi:hypothetical protein